LTVSWEKLTRIIGILRFHPRLLQSNDMTLFFKTALIACCWFLVINPWFPFFFLFPSALVATFVCIDTKKLTTEFCCLSISVFLLFFFFLASLLTGPVIVPADSDFQSGGISDDLFALFDLSIVAMLVSLACASATYLGFFVQRFLTLRIVGEVVLLGFLLVRAFFFFYGSPDTPNWFHQTFISLAGILVVNTALSDKDHNAKKVVLVIVFPTLLILTDVQARTFAGERPSSSREGVGEKNSRNGICRIEERPLVYETSELRITATCGRILAEDKKSHLKHEESVGKDMIPEMLLASPDQKILAISMREKGFASSTIAIWNISLEKPFLQFRANVGTTLDYYLSMSFLGNQALVSSNKDSSVRVFDITTGLEGQRFFPSRRNDGFERVVDCVAASPIGDVFATWSIDGIKLWQVSDLRLLRRIKRPDGIPMSLYFSQDGETLFGENRTKTFVWKVQPAILPFLSLLIIDLLIVATIIWERKRGAASRQKKT